MALVNMLCPRCEVGLQYPSEVPRTTFCPACGFAIRGHAHLIQPIPHGHERVLDLGEFESEPLGSFTDSFDPSLLIKIDPEVKKCLTQLKRGAAAVIGTLVALYVIDVQLKDSSLKEKTAPAMTGALARISTKGESPRKSIETLISAITPSSQEEVNALEALKDILSTENPESLVSWIRDRSLFEATFTEYFKHPKHKVHQAILIEKSPYFANSASVFYYKVTFADDSVRHLTVGKTVSEGYKFDWPTYAVSSGMDWLTFLKQRVETPTYFRVIAKLEGDESAPVLKLSHPTAVAMPIMEAELNPAKGVDREVIFHLKTSLDAEVPMILDLVNLSENAEPTVKVDSFLAKGWYSRTR